MIQQYGCSKEPCFSVKGTQEGLIYFLVKEVGFAGLIGVYRTV